MKTYTIVHSTGREFLRSASFTEARAYFDVSVKLFGWKDARLYEGHVTW